MSRHRCQLNEDNGFNCDECGLRRERAAVQFDADYLPKLGALLWDMRLSKEKRDRFLDELLDAYVDARMEETNDDS